MSPESKCVHLLASCWLCSVLMARALMATCGCSALAVRPCLRVSLDDLPVTAVSASLHSKRDGSAVSALGPGRSAQLVIVATTQDGKQYATVGLGKGTVAFDKGMAHRVRRQS
jgi:hypothetical protein